jgi:predicted molibdopterin-dependent oxidoreductase YjgC
MPSSLYRKRINRLKGNRGTYAEVIIDGKTVKAQTGQTILDAARKAGISIPTLCHLELLEPYGGCRLCVVEVRGMKGFPTSCTTPVEPGMEILTHTPALSKLRKEILEFTLSEHPFTCLVCGDRNSCTDFMHTTRKVSTITGCNFCTSNGDCELQELVDILALEDVKFPITYRGIPPVRDNPFYDLDYNLCVLCGRCIRICSEERNSHVLAFVERGGKTLVGTAFGESQVTAGCEFCGACADVCPTGSISEKIGKWRGIPDKSVMTTCTLCPVGCDMNVNSREGRIVQIGAPPGRRTAPPQLCIRGKFLARHLNDHPSRITVPHIRKGERLVEVTWDEAYAYMATALKDHRNGAFGLIASGQDTLEDNYILQKFAREIMGSGNVDLHGSHPVREVPELIHRFHALYPPPLLDEIGRTGTLLLIGTDASLSHPLLENRIRKASVAGGKVICTGSVPNRTLTFAERFIPCGQGEGLSFLQELLALLNGKDAGGKIREGMKDAASLLSGSGDVVIIPDDSLLRGPDAPEVLLALFSLHGFLGKKAKCRILFPGFEGNLYAGALAGMHPDYLPGLLPSGDPTGSSAEKHGNPVRALMVVGDLCSENGWADTELLIQCNMFRTGISEHAHVLLPVTDFLETEGHVFTMDGTLKKVNRALRPPGKSKSIPSIISGLAGAMGIKGFSSRPAEIFRELKTHLDAGAQEKTWTGKTHVSRKSGLKAGSVPTIPGYDHFRYRGNRIADLVPDLARVHMSKDYDENR